MFSVTYADNENHICHKNGFSSTQDALNWIDENKGKITPFKLLKVGNGHENCPITIKDFKNYESGKYTAEYRIN